MTTTRSALASPEATRREFLASSASGLGGVALASLLAADNPAAVTPAHFAPTAKRCIFFFMAGGPSHVDLFDPKPILNNRDGQKMPDSLLGATEFAFIKKNKAVLKGSPAKFRARGECGIEYSNMLGQIGDRADDIALIRTVHGEQFNHHPGQLLLSCGKAEMGRPSIGAWLTYGLGTESDNLPGYVVLAPAGEPAEDPRTGPAASCPPPTRVFPSVARATRSCTFPTLRASPAPVSVAPWMPWAGSTPSVTATSVTPKSPAASHSTNSPSACSRPHPN